MPLFPPSLPPSLPGWRQKEKGRTAEEEGEERKGEEEEEGPSVAAALAVGSSRPEKLGKKGGSEGG